MKVNPLIPQFQKNRCYVDSMTMTFRGLSSRNLVSLGERSRLGTLNVRDDSLVNVIRLHTLFPAPRAESARTDHAEHKRVIHDETD